MSLYFVIFASLATGLLCQKIPNLPGKLTPVINNFAVYFVLPAIVLAKIPSLEITPDTLFIIAAAWTASLLSMTLIFWIGNRLKWGRDTLIACVVLGGLGNTAFLGLALIRMLTNDQVLGYAVIYDQVGSFLLLALILPIISAIKSSADSDSEHATSVVIDFAKRVLLFPPFICLLAALFLPIAPLTQPLNTPLEWLGLLLLPCAMLVVGMQLQLRISAHFWLPMAVVLLVKMLFAPLITLIAGQSFGLPADIFSATLLQSAMPPMVSPAIFLISLNIAPRLTATILGVGTLLSFLTIPTVVMLLH